MRVFLLDNYDSFTYNLYQYLGMLGAEILVKRNDEFEISEVRSWNVDAVVISPGPSRPENAGKTVDFIMRFFDVNGADIVYRDSTVASEGKMEGIEYSEPIVVEHAEAGFIRVSTSKDFTVEELSALRIVANSVSIAIQTLEGVRPPPGG